MAKSNFQKAVEGTPDISTGYRSGLQALKRIERSSVVATDTRRLDGSLDIDTAVQEKYPNDNRWDYVIGYSGKVCYVKKYNRSQHRFPFVKMTKLFHTHSFLSILQFYHKVHLLGL